jgi:hypothetical protein
MPTIGQTETRLCQVKISVSERAELGRDMGRLELQIERLKYERAGVNKRIRDAETERNKLGHTAESGLRDMDIECWWRRDDAAQEWVLQRPDTGEVVEVRPFNGRDLNHELPFHDAADADGQTRVESDFVVEIISVPEQPDAPPTPPAGQVVSLLAPPPRRPAPKQQRKRGKGKASAAT